MELKDLLTQIREGVGWGSGIHLRIYERENISYGLSLCERVLWLCKNLEVVIDRQQQ